MKAYTPGGRFDAEFETNDIVKGITADLTNPVGTSVEWYVWKEHSDSDPSSTQIDSIYDVGSYTVDGSGGRKWRSSVKVPIIRAVINQGKAPLNEMGLYAPDSLHLTVNKEQLFEFIPDLGDVHDPLYKDRIVWKGQVYRPFYVQLRGIVAERYTILSYDCQQVMGDEMVNDPQFQAYVI